MKWFTLILFCALFPISFASETKDHDHKKDHDEAKTEVKVTVKGTQKKCPVGGREVKEDSFVIVQGQKVHFCCKGCDKKFVKDSEKYFKVMKERGEVASSVQTKCAVSGDVLEDFDTKVELDGRNIYFCCKDCITDFNKDKDTYLKKLDGAKNDEKSKEHDHKGHDHKDH